MVGASLLIERHPGNSPEKAMAPHSSTLAWKTPWMEEPRRLQSMGLLESDTTERLHFHFSLSCIGEGNGNPLQCSCLENPRDGGSWWAAIYGVTQSRTRLKRLSSSSREQLTWAVGEQQAIHRPFATEGRKMIDVTAPEVHQGQGCTTCIG